MTIPSTCITSLFLQNRESQSSNKTNPASRSIGHPQLTEKLLLLEGRRGGVCSLLLVCFLRRGGRLYAKARFDMNLCSCQVCSCWRSPSITAHNNICRGSETRPGSHSDGKTHKAAGRFYCTYVDNSIQVCKTGKYISSIWIVIRFWANAVQYCGYHLIILKWNHYDDVDDVTAFCLYLMNKMRWFIIRGWPFNSWRGGGWFLVIKNFFF